MQSPLNGSISYFKGSKKVLTKAKNITIETIDNELFKELGITSYLVDNITKNQRYLLCPHSICFCGIGSKSIEDFYYHIVLHKNMQIVTDSLFGNEQNRIETDINVVIKNYQEFHLGTLIGQQKKPKSCKKRTNELEQLLNFDVNFPQKTNEFISRGNNGIEALTILCDVARSFKNPSELGCFSQEIDRMDVDKELEDFIENL